MEERDWAWRSLECGGRGGRDIVLCTLFKPIVPSLYPGLHSFLSLERILQGYLARSPVSGTPDLTQTQWTAPGSFQKSPETMTPFSYCRFLSEISN